jgi:DNA-binding beta-propeller fold protein YncE
VKTQISKSSFKNTSRSCFPMAGLISVLSLMLLVSGCATQAPVNDAENVEKEQQTVWPAPPEQARIRYIGELNSLANLAGKEQKSLRDILMGEEEKEEQSELRKPYGVHSDSKGRVFVADTGFAGLIVFDLETKNVSFWGVSGYGALTKPVGVTSDAQGNVYVSDTKDQRIVVFDTDGNYINAFGGKETLTNPAGMVFNDETQQLYVVDAHEHQIIVFNKEGGVDFIIGKRGLEPGEFNFPTNISIDGSGRLYVSDTMNFRIQVLEADGTVVDTFGKVGDRPGNFNRLKGIGVDKQGHIYAVDASYNNFQVFNDKGQLLLIVGQSGNSGPAGFYMPAGAHVDKNNRIFIADQLNRKIQMFEYIGQPDPTEPAQ